MLTPPVGDRHAQPRPTVVPCSWGNAVVPSRWQATFTLSQDHLANIATIPKVAWTEAYDSDGKTRDGAWVVDATGVLDLATWPKGMRDLIRAE